MWILQIKFVMGYKYNKWKKYKHGIKAKLQQIVLVLAVQAILGQRNIIVLDTGKDNRSAIESTIARDVNMLKGSKLMCHLKEKDPQKLKTDYL